MLACAAWIGRGGSRTARRRRPRRPTWAPCAACRPPRRRAAPQAPAARRATAWGRRPQPSGVQREAALVAAAFTVVAFAARRRSRPSGVQSGDWRGEGVASARRETSRRAT
eukprot:4990504-Pleurochrysis_carterae.AAC.1